MDKSAIIKALMIFLTTKEGNYFTLTVDDLKVDENGVPTVTTIQKYL